MWCNGGCYCFVLVSEPCGFCNSIPSRLDLRSDTPIQREGEVGRRACRFWRYVLIPLHCSKVDWERDVT
jgi:hypothetical protein